MRPFRRAALSTAAFALPPLDARGNREPRIGRNALRGFAWGQVEVWQSARHPVARPDCNLRVEAFNLFNQISFGLPANALSTAFSASLRARWHQPGTGAVAGAGSARCTKWAARGSIQLALRLQF